MRSGPGKRPRRTRRRGAGPARRRTLADIVAHYVEHRRESACARLAFYALQPSLGHALVTISEWRDADGKPESRQKHIPAAAKAEAGERIRNLAVADAKSFKDIHRRVQEALGSIYSIGPQTVYDVALRIGAVLGYPPTEVHLHRGAREGARALGFDPRLTQLSLRDLPQELRRLYAWEIGNFLGLYKNELMQLRKSKRAA